MAMDRLEKCSMKFAMTDRERILLQLKLKMCIDNVCNRNHTACFFLAWHIWVNTTITCYRMVLHIAVMALIYLGTFMESKSQFWWIRGGKEDTWNIGVYQCPSISNKCIKVWLNQLGYSHSEVVQLTPVDCWKCFIPQRDIRPKNFHNKVNGKKGYWAEWPCVRNRDKPPSRTFFTMVELGTVAWDGL